MDIYELLGNNIFPKALLLISIISYGNDNDDTVEQSINAHVPIVFNEDDISIQNDNFQINVSDYSAGIYQVKLVTEEYYISKLIVIN